MIRILFIFTLFSSSAFAELRGTDTARTDFDSHIKIEHINPMLTGDNGRVLPLSAKGNGVRHDWPSSSEHEYCRQHKPEGRFEKLVASEMEGNRVLNQDEYISQDRQYGQAPPYSMSPNDDGSYSYYGSTLQAAGTGKWRKMKGYAASKITCRYYFEE